ncbi:MAG: Holliday junction resolvase RecU [bacterium]|nr:Holliday junction resolvase RecU [bacterium]
MNYPKGIRIKNNKSINYANRGMTLENDINQTNEYYKEIEKAIIYKRPTPIQVTKVHYPSQGKVIIKEAYFLQPSTLDYCGIYNGKYIDFDVKETTSKTSFPIKNIHPHQLKHIEQIIRHKGIAFLIIRFTKLNETYLLFAKELIEYINKTDKASIPYNYIKDKGHIVEIKYSPRLDYLKIIEEKLEE